jgi:Ca-activated chloride channel family protein
MIEFETSTQEAAGRTNHVAGWTDRLDAVSRTIDRSLERFPATWRKPLYFGVWGAVGCLLGAFLFGEIALALLMPGPPKKPQADIVFVLDVTASMQFAINGVRDGIRDFAEGLGDKADLDSRIGLVAFRDRQIGEEASVLEFGKETLTTDLDAFRREVSKLRASGGGDVPETSLDGIAKACALPFRPEATRVLVLITDAPPKVPDGSFHTVSDVRPVMQKAGINQVHLVINDGQQSIYAPLQKGVVGRMFSLGAAARAGGFNDILPDLGREIAEKIRGLQSGREVDRSSFWSLVFAIGVWTATLAVGLALALIVGQNVYLKREPLALQEGLKGGFGGFAAGMGAGAAGQFLFQVLPYRLFQMGGWTLLGCLLGGGMAFFVPNLDRKRALQAGAIGGAVGCLGFLMASALLGDVIGRLLGSAVLGLAIGLMVGLVEMAFRDAWLEVAYGPDGKEKRTVSLGRVPVGVGSDRDCKVWARDAAPVAFRYKFEAGKVTCEDVEGKKAEVAANGDRRSVGKLVLTVHLSSRAATAGPSPAKQEAAPSPTTPPKPVAPAPSAGPTIKQPESKPAAAAPASPVAPTSAAKPADPRPAPAAPARPAGPTPINPAVQPLATKPAATTPTPSAPKPAPQPAPSRTPLMPMPQKPGAIGPPPASSPAPTPTSPPRRPSAPPPPRPSGPRP